ncbi:MAG: hypothetical protein RLP44_26635, partial [Aggregatilineales bacterium]
YNCIRSSSHSLSIFNTPFYLLALTCNFTGLRCQEARQGDVREKPYSRCHKTIHSSGKLYFTERRKSKVDSFKACSDYLRKVGRHDGDMKLRRYFYVGKRHGVTIFEPYNPVTNDPETYLNQRLIWQESDFDFEQARMNYGIAVQIEA